MLDQFSNQSREQRRMAESTTILRAVVGSTLHGLAVDGMDDRDEMGVCVEDIKQVVGLNEFEQVVQRTAAIREGKHDAKSKPGDLDLVIYSLRKYVRLALNGNPTIINLLYAPRPFVTVLTLAGEQLQALAPYIVSRRAGKAFLGYAEAQRQRLLGERGSMKVRRPDLIEKHGFDAKYAMHLLRLCLQGIELLTTGRLTFPMPEDDRMALIAVRTGQVKVEEVLKLAVDYERKLKDLLVSLEIREEPDRERVESWMIDTYAEAWRQRDVVGKCVMALHQGD